MTLPKASKFPALPEGYRFEIEHIGVSYKSRENEYTIWVMPLDPDEDEDWPLVSGTQVIESYVLDTVRRLAELAYLEVAAQDGTTESRVLLLNRELQQRAARSRK